MAAVWLLSLTAAAPLCARVSGQCANCHTVTKRLDGATAKLPLPGELDIPTVGSCLGCHSSSGSETIGWVGACQVPIVCNGSPPDRPLAAGNFYWVGRGGDHDACGHNVLGVSTPDSRLACPPGTDMDPSTKGCSCHVSLAMDDPQDPEGLVNGCMGCHMNVRHHAPDPVTGVPAAEENGCYRFLSGHAPGPGLPPAGCEGIEDPTWEHDCTATSHNYYKGSLSISDPACVDHICCGCHTLFGTHQAGGQGWVRHPTEILLPTTGEFRRYDCVGAYNPEVPVGFLDPSAPSRNTAVVLCLTCHRAHGSPYPSMLRWSQTDLAVNQGCRVCHTNK
ncbi:MAG: cytochrome c3 family protein [Pseudomonadota bacterium]